MKFRTLFTLSILFVWLCIGCNEPKRDTALSISFAIEGYGNDTLQLWQNDFLNHSEINSEILILDESGSGSLELKFPDTSFGFIKIGDYTFPVIHVIGSSLEISGNISDPANTFKFSGNAAIPNEYLQEKKAIIKKYSNLDGKFFFQLDSMQFWDRIRAFRLELDSLNNWLAKQRLDKSLEALLRSESQQSANLYIINYALVKGYKTRAYSAITNYDQSLFESLSTAYSSALFFNYDFEFRGPILESSGASNNDSIAYLFPQIFKDALDTIGLPKHAKEYYIARLLTDYYGSHQSNPILDSVRASWRSEFPSSNYQTAVDEAYDAMSSLARGTTAPNIIGIDPSGKEFLIEQFKGHYIYIDVWATWCSPCREKIPKMYALHKEFSGNPHLKFLFVSVDENLEKWLNYISKHSEEILHINVNSAKLRKEYLIHGVPHYIIIDPSGKIYNPDAPGPDTEAIYSILKEISETAS